MTEKAKTCAHLLGWTWRGDARGILPNRGEVLVGPDGDGRFVVSVDRSTGATVGGVSVALRDNYTVERHALMLCACLRDVGDLDLMRNAAGTVKKIVPAWEAVLRATPAMCSACGGYGGVTASGESATLDMCQTVCERCGGCGRFPGHEGARKALDHLAERLFDVIRKVNDHGVTAAAWHPDVAGDALLDLGETWAMVLAGCPGLPVWLESWMHGTCAECDGAGEHDRGTEWIWARDEREAEQAALDLHAFGANANVRYVTVHNRRDDGEGTGVNLIRYVRCDVCGGTGSSIGQHAGAIEACLDTARR